MEVRSVQCLLLEERLWRRDCGGEIVEERLWRKKVLYEKRKLAHCCASYKPFTDRSKWHHDQFKMVTHLRATSTMRATSQCVSFSYFDFTYGNKVTPLVLMFRWTAARWTTTGRIAQPWMTAMFAWFSI